MTVGVFESVFFRGFVQARLEASLGTVPGVGLAAVLYGAYHVGYGMGGKEMAFLVGLARSTPSPNRRTRCESPPQPARQTPTPHSQDQTNRCLALEATTTGRPILAGITTLAVAELRLTPGTPVWTTVKATDVDVYAAGPDQPVPGPPI